MKTHIVMLFLEFLFVAAIGPLAVYALISFVEWKLVPGDWSVWSRLSAGVFGGVWVIKSGLAFYEEWEDLLRYHEWKNTK